MDFVNQQIKRIRVATKMLILIIFVGYTMIWIVMPTNEFWLHWLPHIHAKTDSSYLGQQGANILIYTFPILLIAILGCMYLHLEKYGDDTNNRSRLDQHFGSWKQPLLIRSPLGIVSCTELLFVLMFIALLVWSFSAYVHGMFKNITRQSASKMGDIVWEVRLDSVALLLGLVGNICLSFLFFPVARGSPILRLVGLTSESSIKYHIWLGHTALTLFLSHGLCYVVFWANTDQISEMLKWSRIGISNVAGEVALFCGIVMWIASFSRVRRKLFELFFYTHHLYIVFVAFFVLHVGFSYSCIMLPGFYLFLVDRFLRLLQSQEKIRVVSARVLPCHAVELNFSKDPRLNYTPSSVVFINVKSISRLQWHPFTVTSNKNMDPDQLSIVIKSEGSWSRELYSKLSSATPLDHHLQVTVEGPYASPSTSFLRHEMLVLVSGGSGITPFISIIRELIVLSNAHEETPRVLLVAAFKKSAEITMLNLLLPLSGTPHNVSHLRLQIQAYVSRDTNPSTDSQKLPINIWFEPSVSEAPVTGVLGSSSWLWLGAIISASFVIFLLIISIFNRLCIHPTDSSTHVAYSYAARSFISALFLCVAVVIVASIAFVWNKKRNIKECRQIQSAETLSPTERELESVPEESLKQVTTVHYGERPNFKKILSECEGADIGVFVSGPEKMKQDVAAICSYDSAKGLHYQSFSFNW